MAGGECATCHLVPSPGGATPHAHTTHHSQPVGRVVVVGARRRRGGVAGLADRAGDGDGGRGDGGPPGGGVSWALVEMGLLAAQLGVGAGYSLSTADSLRLGAAHGDGLGEGSEGGHGGEERHDNVGEEHGGFWRWGGRKGEWAREGVVDGEKSAFFRRAGEDEVGGGDDGGLRRTSPQFLTVMRTFLDPMDPRCLETGSCSLTRSSFAAPPLAALTALVR